ncbi:hypothetical protein D3C73_645680 [compost metagenome]
MLFTGSGRALHYKSRVAVDGRRQILRQPGFGRTRLADQQQRPVRDQCGDRHFDQARVADVFGRYDLFAGLAACDKSQHRTRRHLPASRDIAFVLLAQRLQLLPVQYLCRQPHIILKLFLFR